MPNPMLRRTARWFTFLCGAYLGVAYFAAPGLWSLRDGRLLDMPGGIITRTPQGIAGDPINVGLVGSERDVVRAFGLAKWDTADAVTLRSAIHIGESVLFDHPYPDAPVSPLVFEGRREDLAFELPVGQSADQRHHVQGARSRHDHRLRVRQRREGRRLRALRPGVPRQHDCVGVRSCHPPLHPSVRP